MGLGIIQNTFHGWKVTFDQLQRSWDLIRKNFNFTEWEFLQDDAESNLGEVLDNVPWGFVVGQFTFEMITLSTDGHKTYDFAIGVNLNKYTVSDKPNKEPEGIPDDILDGLLSMKTLKEYELLKGIIVVVHDTTPETSADSRLYTEVRLG